MGKGILLLIFIAFMLYAGIQLLLIAFGLRKPKFKDFGQQTRFEANYRKYHLIMKLGAIAFLATFSIQVVSSGVLKNIFSLIF